MTRRILATVMALGALITVMSFGGIYATFTDRATTGTTGGTSASLPGGADIELARALTATGCPVEDFDDDLTSDLIQWSNAKPGDDLGTHFFCIRNVGVAHVSIGWSITDEVGSDHGCTGDEADVDDSCGADAYGELRDVLIVKMRKYDCASGTPVGFTSSQYISQAGSPQPIYITGDDLEPGETNCVSIQTFYPAYDNGTSVAAAQVAQSDTISWRFAFDATGL